MRTVRFRTEGVVNGRLMLITLAMFLAASVSRAGDSPLKGADLTDHISGPALTETNVMGKVVFLEYWGLG